MADVAGTKPYYATQPASGENTDEAEASQTVAEEAKASAIIPMTALFQPLIFARTLTQVGYEPMEPVRGVSLFRRVPGYYYPNIFEYLNHMRKVEGSVFVLFTGLTPKIMNVMTSTATDRAAEKFVRDYLPYSGEDANAPMHRKYLGGTLYEMAVSCVSKSAALVVSHPFHVVMVRMICSVINKDQAYQGFFNTVKQIYNDEGLPGFYSGLIPRWIAEMMTVTIGGSIMYGIYRTMSVLDVEEEPVRSSPNYNALVQFSLSQAMYKYQLTSTVTAATCKGLHIGLPSHSGWASVYADLQLNKQFGRGGSYFYRKAMI